MQSGVHCAVNRNGHQSLFEQMSKLQYYKFNQSASQVNNMCIVIEPTQGNLQWTRIQVHSDIGDQTQILSLHAPYCWAMMRGMLGLSDCRGANLSPVRKLNMGRVERGATRRPSAMLLSSSLFPWMVWWWYIWILQRATEGGFIEDYGGGGDEVRHYRGLWCWWRRGEAL